MWLLVIFVAVPLIEIALFIQLGGAIGLWPTLGIVVLTAFVGTWLMRAQGALAMAELRGSFSELRDPTEPLAHGAMILIAGALLLTPGFFTDTVGFLLLIPPFRRATYRYVRSRISVQRFEMGQRPDEPNARPSGDEEVIDGSFKDVTPEKRQTHPPSGWTKH